MKNLKKEDGFTLVELMVVVAIIGVLSAVAIPNFKKYQAKAKTSEAKLQLSSIYSAETAFMADADTYETCLDDMGYNPSGEIDSRYYVTGFQAALGSGTEVNGVACDSDANFMYDAGKQVAGSASTGDTFLKTYATPIVDNGGSTFIAGAGGHIDAGTKNSNAADFDQWTVNESKYFKHTNTGY